MSVGPYCSRTAPVARLSQALCVLRIDGWRVGGVCEGVVAVGAREASEVVVEAVVLLDEEDDVLDRAGHLHPLLRDGGNGLAAALVLSLRRPGDHNPGRLIATPA